MSLGITFTDVFCGAGGSSIGLTAAGLELKLGANHSPRAIETHALNFPDADHLCADVTNYDWRRAPRTDVGWFSPECTWHSPAGGRKQASKVRAQLDMFDDYVPNDLGVRSRATAFDVIRAAEVHRYKVVIVENVVEFAAWEMYDWFIDGLRRLGYTVQIVCVSSAHIGDDTNEHAPQWRDRWYAFCTAKGVPVPDVRPRPAAWCPVCDEVVAAVQVAMLRKNNYPRGIDEPLAPLTTGRSHGLTSPEPFVTTLRQHARPEPASEPLSTVAAGGNHHAVTTPPGAFIQKHHGGLDYGPIGHMTKSVDEPLPSVVAKPNQSLVIPYRRGNRTRTTGEPLPTLHTKDGAGLASIAIDVEDCYFRMLQPREHARAQRFPDSYTITGNKGEQTMQAGNAVSSNVAQWLGSIAAQVLGGVR